MISKTSMIAMLACTVALGAAGCGVAAMPIAAEPKEGIRAAEELGADSNPQASLHLKLAKDQVAYADKLTQEGDTVGAQWALMRASADAELAVELTKQQKLQGEAVETQDKIIDLQKKTAQ